MIEDELLRNIAETYGTPTYVYDKNKMCEQYHLLDTSIEFSPKKIYYACKANSNVNILRILKNLNCCIDVVSPGELFLALRAGFDPSEILFTGNNLTNSEMEYAVDKNVLMTLDSLSQLERYGRINPHSDVSIRININVGAGYHKHTVTGGLQSKFGIYYTYVKEIKEKAKTYDLRIVGVHMHIGSGILEYRILLKCISILLEVASHFPDIAFIDIGGGLGIPSRPGESPLDCRLFGKKLSARFDEWVREHKKNITLILEPGRFLVAEAGILLARVQMKKRNPKYTFVGLDTGFNHFMRPILYNAFHKIEKVGDESGEKEKVTICGNICENGDIFGRNVELPRLREGDLLAIRNVGAYGFSMASLYNSRMLPAEVLVDGSTVSLIRNRGKFEDLLVHQVNEGDNNAYENARNQNRI
jgi:diaminopimelate decarboxylase